MNHLLLEGDVIAHHATVTWTYNTWTYWTYWLLLIGQNYRFIHHWSLNSDWFHLIFGLFLCSCVLTFLALCSLRIASSRHAQVETVITDWLPSNCCVTITFHLPFLSSCSQSHHCWHHISVYLTISIFYHVFTDVGRVSIK